MLLAKMFARKSSAATAPLCSVALLLFGGLGLFVQAIDLKELGPQVHRNRNYMERKVESLEGEEDWELNQVFLAAKLAYFVTKSASFIDNRPFSEELTRFEDAGVSDPRFYKRVLARETERACYIAHMNPFDKEEDLTDLKWGPFGYDVDGLAELTETELSLSADWASAADDTKTCTTRLMFTQLLPYSFAGELDALLDNCIASGKRIVHTGHSYGAVLATLAAVRREADMPWLITFGAPPMFDGECTLIDPERNVRIVNTEVDMAFHMSGAMMKEPILTYDIISWNFIELLAKDLLTAISNGELVNSYVKVAYDSNFPSEKNIVRALIDGFVSPDLYPPFLPLHLKGGVTLLPPFPFRNEPSTVFLNDSHAEYDVAASGELYWYKDFFPDMPAFFFFPNFYKELLLPVNAMRKYYSKIRELLLQKRLGITARFERGTYCQSDLHCPELTKCMSPPGNMTTMCLFDDSVMPYCPDVACLEEEVCVDGFCSAGLEGDFCIQHSDCTGSPQACIKGRCCSGAKGQPCLYKGLDCQTTTVCNLRHDDFYPLCWNSDLTNDNESGGGGKSRKPPRGG